MIFIRVTGKFVSFSLSVRDGGGVLVGVGGGDGGGGGSNNEKIFLVYKEEDSGQDSVSAFLFTWVSVWAGTQSELGGGGYLSEEDGRGGAEDRGDGGGVHVGSSENVKIFLVFKEE